MGSMADWDRTTPAGSDSLSAGDDRIRSDKSILEFSLNEEHFYTTASASSRSGGIHRLGSSRVYVGTRSQVSAPADGQGRLMWANDVSPAGAFFIFPTTGSSVSTVYAPQVSSKATNTGTQAAASASFSTVTFANEVWDTDGLFSPTTSRFVIPSYLSGHVFRLDGSLVLQQAGGQPLVRIIKNAATVISAFSADYESSGPYGCQITGYDRAIGGDFYELVYGSGAASLTTVNDGAPGSINQFVITRV